MRCLTVALLLVLPLVTMARPDCTRQLYDAMRAVQPFVPDSALPAPPRALVLPEEPCDRECLQRFRAARLEEFKAKDVLLQAARSQMLQALQECAP